jgi:hypothetical protein
MPGTQVRNLSSLKLMNNVLLRHSSFCLNYMLCTHHISKF